MIYVTYKDLTLQYGSHGARRWVRTLERLAQVRNDTISFDQEARLRRALPALNSIDFAAYPPPPTTKESIMSKRAKTVASRTYTPANDETPDGLLRSAFETLQTIANEGLTFSSEQAAEHLLDRMKKVVV